MSQSESDDDEKCCACDEKISDSHIDCCFCQRKCCEECSTNYMDNETGALSDEMFTCIACYRVKYPELSNYIHCQWCYRMSRPSLTVSCCCCQKSFCIGCVEKDTAQPICTICRNSNKIDR